MIYELKVKPRYFNRIKNKLKTIEMRVYKDKYINIKINDEIIFKNEANNKTIRCLVTNIFKYNSFIDLYKNHSKEVLGYHPNEIASPTDMNKFYSNECITKHGVIGIEIKLI